jgi:hypothetical protein
MKCVPLRLDSDELIRVDTLATHFHASRADILRCVVRMGIGAFFDAYQANPSSAENALATVSTRTRRALTQTPSSVLSGGGEK